MEKMVRLRKSNCQGAGGNGDASAVEPITGCCDNLDEAKAVDADVSGACYEDRILD